MAVLTQLRCSCMGFRCSATAQRSFSWCQKPTLVFQERQRKSHYAAGRWLPSLTGRGKRELQLLIPCGSVFFLSFSSSLAVTPSRQKKNVVQFCFTSYTIMTHAHIDKLFAHVLLHYLYPLMRKKEKKEKKKRLVLKIRVKLRYRFRSCCDFFWPLLSCWSHGSANRGGASRVMIWDDTKWSTDRASYLISIPCPTCTSL